VKSGSAPPGFLLDQNGDKRYVKGPDVVFPKPTETFIENKGQKVFRALELNENMGIYIKVIADYASLIGSFAFSRTAYILYAIIAVAYLFKGLAPVSEESEKRKKKKSKIQDYKNVLGK
jgi:hypothetical protein